MNLDTTFKLGNLIYWVIIVCLLGYFFEVDHWSKWVALVLAAFADSSKTKNIRVWERYNINQEKKESKNDGRS